jgi:flagellar basal-body rod modification protein FlgD
MSTTPVTPNPTTGTTGASTTTGLPSGQSLNNMFLQLLIAQLQNQDPTDPVDPSQFVGQLAQFSELSEVTSIYQLLSNADPAAAAGTGTGTGGTSSSLAVGPANAAKSAASVLVLPSIPALGAGSALAPAAASPPGGIPGATAPTNPATTNFLSPSISAITSKIQGAF